MAVTYRLHMIDWVKFNVKHSHRGTVHLQFLYHMQTQHLEYTSHSKWELKLIDSKERER